MISGLHDSWHGLLHGEDNKPYYKSLMMFVQQEYTKHTCYPRESHIFAAFNHCHLEKTKVVIIGQDPYHGPNQANGLCFSVSRGVAHPPSLVNIFREIESDLGKAYPEDGNLEHWANQGVFLLNAILTVRAHEAGSHQKKGWERFTDTVIQKLSNEKEGLVFLLWGGFAKKKSKLIDTKKHYILTSGHPSPLSANRGYWFGNKHFSKTNKILLENGKQPINW
ncbi:MULTISPECIES: uracil-DNA glycosylase [unclassified Arenibacter]|uniref:uracil-DNA glycosylase n=1 Tax=unclassified Arenibacter TaxID=2615047 RepID=UPI000E3525D2|nr:MULTISPECIES: uracil-DNA glycosylase [unclassified Arenibacter]MCM4163251.1 uracil-DNA glycosylase [Arenibacter sp. A80]RFT57268.1 uracil-DNA glycosylase [Arenibacter sp. P308M17]